MTAYGCLPPGLTHREVAGLWVLRHKAARDRADAVAMAVLSVGSGRE